MENRKENIYMNKDCLNQLYEAIKETLSETEIKCFEIYMSHKGNYRKTEIENAGLNYNEFKTKLINLNLFNKAGHVTDKAIQFREYLKTGQIKQVTTGSFKGRTFRTVR